MLLEVGNDLSPDEIETHSSIRAIRAKFQNVTPFDFNPITIAVNISERKSGTERTKKRKKRELVCFPTARGRNGVNRDTWIFPELR